MVFSFIGIIFVLVIVILDYVTWTDLLQKGTYRPLIRVIEIILVMLTLVCFAGNCSDNWDADSIEEQEVELLQK